MSVQSFFFRKEPVEGIALFRIAFSLVLLLNALLMIPNLFEFFGPQGMVEPASPVNLQTLNLFYFLPMTRGAVSGVFSMHLLSVLMLLVGFRTRWAAFLGYLTLSSLHQVNHLVLHSGDTASKLLLFLLIFSRAGDAFSLDHWIRCRQDGRLTRPRLQWPWAQRLIQIQVAFLYFSTTFLKFDGEGWANGSAVYYTSRLWDFERFPVPYLFDHLWTLKAMTWFSLFIEGALGTLIWFTPLRVPLIIVGIVFHFSIEYTMNIPVFEWVMISMLVAMLAPREAWYFCESLKKRWALRIHADTSRH